MAFLSTRKVEVCPEVDTIPEKGWAPQGPWDVDKEDWRSVSGVRGISLSYPSGKYLEACRRPRLVSEFVTGFFSGRSETARYLRLPRICNT